MTPEELAEFLETEEGQELRQKFKDLILQWSERYAGLVTINITIEVGGDVTIDG